MSNSFSDELADHGRLNAVELCSLLKIGRTKLYELIQQPSFPRRIKVVRSVRWVKGEVLAYLRRQEEEARG